MFTVGEIKFWFSATRSSGMMALHIDFSFFLSMFLCISSSLLCHHSSEAESPCWFLSQCLSVSHHFLWRRHTQVVFTQTLSSVYNGINGWVFTSYGIFLRLLIGQKIVTKTNRRTVWSHVTRKMKTTSPVTMPLKVSGKVIFIKLWVTWLHTVLSLVDQSVKLPAFCPSYGV